MRKKIALSLASLAFTLVFLEIALRLLGVAQAGRGSEWFAGGNHPRFLFQPDRQAGYSLRPNFTGVEVNPEGDFKATVAIDPQGLRVQPHSAPEAAGAPVALALGDSMTFGEGVVADRTYSAIAERVGGLRVYNGGVPGYSSKQMVDRLEALLPRLRPRVVTLAFSPLWDRQRCAQPFTYKEGFIVAQGYVDRLYLSGGNLYLAETRLPVVGAATAYAKAWSRVMRVLLPPLGKAAHAIIHRSGTDDTPRSEEYDATVANVERAAALCAEAKAGFVALLLDDRGTDYRRDRMEIERRLADHHLAYMAVDEAIPQADWKRLRFEHDGHWNLSGHQAAGLLLANLARQYLPRE